MSKYVTIVISCVIFLTSLLFFKTVINALGLALFFVFLVTLLEVAWQYRQSVFLRMVTKVFIAAIIALSVYASVYLPIEYLLTEVWLVVPKIPLAVSPILLLVLVSGYSLINWNDLLKIKTWRLAILGYMVISGLIYFGYRQNKLAREYLPKIYHISPSQGIQAQLVEISGVNFFPIWKKGKILLDNQEMGIVSWNEELIVAEQTVPSRLGQTDLFIVRSDRVESNKLPYTIRDPNTLK